MYDEDEDLDVVSNPCWGLYWDRDCDIYYDSFTMPYTFKSHILENNQNFSENTITFDHDAFSLLPIPICKYENFLS